MIYKKKPVKYTCELFGGKKDGVKIIWNRRLRSTLVFSPDMDNNTPLVASQATREGHPRLLYSYDSEKNAGVDMPYRRYKYKKSYSAERAKRFLQKQLKRRLRKWLAAKSRANLAVRR